jgi:hypothetical protein
MIVGMGQPDWTGHNVHDPGSPLLQLLAFLEESVLFRARDRDRRRRLIALLVAIGVGLLWWRRRDDG